MPDVVVVGAAIVDGGRLLVGKRAEPPALAGGWELPGGKVDPGESDEDALVRECREELAVEVALTARLGGEWHIPPSGVLRVWAASIVSGVPQALEHAALRWLGPEELYDVPWLRADLPVLPHLRVLLSGDGEDRPAEHRPASRE